MRGRVSRMLLVRSLVYGIKLRPCRLKGFGMPLRAAQAGRSLNGTSRPDLQYWLKAGDNFG